MKKNIAITYGDPKGIGPEILQKILESAELEKYATNINFAIYGNKQLFTNLFLSNVSFVDSSGFLSAEESGDPGHHSFKCLERAIQDALLGQIQGLVTGPISKHNWSEAGYNYKGQTELLGEKFNTSPEMLFLGSKQLVKTNFQKHQWRIMLLTRHVALKEVSGLINLERLREASQILKKFLTEKCKIQNPRIALAGINPHAGEKGEIGREEIDYLTDWCSQLGIEGPFSPDEIWYQSSQAYMKDLPQEFDAYLAPYHDQVLPLIKTVTNLSAVNTTIGLPILRTSPDHGTAFGLVGKNLADHKPFLEAIKTCVELV
ncbi:MAG: 4-hydroxythreonine-4-phosphate dehydrogenase PdxA [Candidatus Caenarcaniphilales bacterium]|nr:4-hydroxythreonine-4-phosphate dehydrogenase PdxA [Candidatus Caenarcaniphilales bacterium]